MNNFYCHAVAEWFKEALTCCVFYHLHQHSSPFLSNNLHSFFPCGLTTSMPLLTIYANSIFIPVFPILFYSFLISSSHTYCNVQALNLKHIHLLSILIPYSSDTYVSVGTGILSYNFLFNFILKLIIMNFQVRQFCL